jgi:plastocyanin
VLERKSITALSAEELASLRLGVAEMKRRSEENPDDETGWLFQANLHALPAILDPVPTWCQHNSWYFFPWHRMYLYRLERILQDSADNPNLRLPYWNYSDDPAQRVLPPALSDELDASGNPNSLYESRRAPGMNDGTVPLTEEAVVYSTAFLDKDFFPLVSGAAHFGGERLAGPAYIGPEGGSLEGTPHGNVHNEVGGSEGFIGLQPITFPVTIAYHCSIHPSMTGTINVVNDPTLPPGTRFIEIVDFRFVPDNVTMPVGSAVQWINMGDEEHTVTADDGSFDSGPISPNGYMALLELAARDTAFWLHHANIDRLWERWLALKDGRANPTGEADWMDQTFPFYDVDGTKVHMAVSDVLDTKCLGYTFDDPLTVYEPEEPGAISATPAAIAAQEARSLGESPAGVPIEIGAESVSIAVELAPAAEEDLARVATSAATPAAGARAPSLSMTLEGIENIAAPGITFAVYVNLPPDVEPDPNSDYFVGTIYLFVLRRHGDHDMAEGGARQTFNITRAVQASQARADAPSGVTVTIVPAGADRIMARLATPVPEGTQPFVDAARGPWVSVERITVLATE